MIPDLHWTTIPIGPITIQVWGLFVALGIMASLLVARSLASKRGLQPDVIIDLSFWVILAAIIGSRVFFVLTDLSLYTQNWLDVFKIWQGGLSVSGGLIAATVTGLFYLRLKKLPILDYAEVMIYALPLGFAIGRLGCFFIFDHPGHITNLFFGERYYADGLVHTNHGLFLALDGAILFALFSWLRRKYNPKPPHFIIMFLLWEGAVRFMLDFDRILDTAYFGFKAAQWIDLLMFIGAFILFGQRQNLRKKFPLKTTL